MAHLEKRKDWYYLVFKDAARKPVRKLYPLKVKQKRAAEQIADGLRARFAAGTFDPWTVRRQAHIAVTFDEARAAFFQDRSHLQPKTVEAYTYALKGLADVLPAGATLGAVTATDVRRYVENRSASESTRLHRWRHLRAFFQWALDTGLLETNPVQQVRRPKASKKEAGYLSESELDKLLASIEAYASSRIGKPGVANPYWLRDVVTLAVWTGLRLGEVCALRWRSVDLEQGLLTVECTEHFRTKSGHERRVPLLPASLALLLQLKARFIESQPDGVKALDGFVLTGEKGKPLGPSFTSHSFKKAVKRAHLSEGIHFHSLRHTAASWLVMKGVPLMYVRDVLGHGDLSLTQRYAHLSPEGMHAAVKQAFAKT